MVADENLDNGFFFLELFCLIAVTFCCVNPWNVFVDLLDVLNFVEVVNLLFFRDSGDFGKFLVLSDSEWFICRVFHDGVNLPFNRSRE